MRQEFFVTQIFYHKRPRPGQCFEIEFDDKLTAIKEVHSWRQLGFTVHMYRATDMPLFFHDSREEQAQEKEVVIIPSKRGRKAKYS